MFFLIVSSNLLYWYTLGMPAVIILPLLWIGSIAAEMYLQITSAHKKHKRRLMTYMGLVMCLICEVMMWFLQFELAIGFYISYHLAAVILLGSLVGKLGYALMERVQMRKRDKKD